MSERANAELVAMLASALFGELQARSRSAFCLTASPGAFPYGELKVAPAHSETHWWVRLRVHAQDRIEFFVEDRLTTHSAPEVTIGLRTNLLVVVDEALSFVLREFDRAGQLLHHFKKDPTP